MIGMSHIGICVSDLARSLKFYSEGLGALELGFLEVGTVMPDYPRLLDIESDIDVFSKFVDLDGTLLELLYYSSKSKTSRHVGSSDARPMNGLGPTHLSLRIADVDEFRRLPDRVRALGGRVLQHSHLEFGEFDGEKVEAIFATDPDGTRIELMRLPSNFPVGGTLYKPRKLSLVEG